MTVVPAWLAGALIGATAGAVIVIGANLVIREGDPRYNLVQDLIEGDGRTQDEALEKLKRCPSCEHSAVFHDVDGRCWFTVASGLPETNLVCPCKLPPPEE